MSETYSPSLARKLKNKIDYRLAIIETAAGEMGAIVDDAPVVPIGGALDQMHSIAKTLKQTIDDRTRQPQ